MTQLFLTLLTLSGQASLLVLGILLLRLLLRQRLPRRLCCLMWLLVALRLLLPFRFSSPVSLQPQEDPLAGYLQQESILSDTDNASFDGETASGPAPAPSAAPTAPAETHVDLTALLTGLWLAGMAAMLAYFVLSYLRLRRRVSDAAAAEGYYRSAAVDSPFILGLLRPRIYLPAAMAEEDIPHVLAHERAHLRRRDHWTKPLSFLLLTLYWFNPLLWLAYVLLCRDIEGACDETVLRNGTPEQRAAYSRALVACAAPARRVVACPLAFGSSDVPGRVRRILSYRKPTVWVLAAAGLGVVVAVVCLLGSPSAARAEPGAEPPALHMSAGQLSRMSIPYVGDPSAVVDLLQKLGFDQYGDFTIRLEDNCSYAHFDYITPREGPDGVVVVYQAEDPETLLNHRTELYYLSLLGVELIDNASWLQCVVETEEGTLSLAELTCSHSPIDNSGEMSQRAYLSALLEEIDRRMTLYRSRTLPWTPVEPDTPRDYDAYFAQTRRYYSGDRGYWGTNAEKSGSAGYGVISSYCGVPGYSSTILREQRDYLWDISLEPGCLPLVADDQWIYFREGNEITRRDYWGGQRTVLWTDETGRLSGLSEEQCSEVSICGQRVLFYIAGCGDGYALYRLFLPTGQADVLSRLSAEQVEEEGLHIYQPYSSQQVYLSGMRGEDEQRETYYLSCVEGQAPQPVAEDPAA